MDVDENDSFHALIASITLLFIKFKCLFYI